MQYLAKQLNFREEMKILSKMKRVQWDCEREEAAIVIQKWVRRYQMRVYYRVWVMIFLKWGSREN